jgi:hypothetical protein
LIVALQQTETPQKSCNDNLINYDSRKRRFDAGEFCKEGWQALLNVRKVLQAGLFRLFCLLPV